MDRTTYTAKELLTFTRECTKIINNNRLATLTLFVIGVAIMELIITVSMSPTQNLAIWPFGAGTTVGQLLCGSFTLGFCLGTITLAPIFFGLKDRKTKAEKDILMLKKQYEMMQKTLQRYRLASRQIVADYPLSEIVKHQLDINDIGRYVQPGSLFTRTRAQQHQ